MLIQFKVVQDDSSWMIDTVRMTYARSNGEGDTATIAELGKLIFIGLQGPLRIFALEGRTPKSEGEGQGLCSLGYALVDLDTTITFFVQANVAIKDLQCRRPVDTIRYELIPTKQEETDASQEGKSEGTPEPQEPTVSGSISGREAQEEPATPGTNIQPGD